MELSDVVSLQWILHLSVPQRLRTTNSLIILCGAIFNLAPGKWLRVTQWVEAFGRWTLGGPTANKLTNISIINAGYYQSRSKLAHCQGPNHLIYSFYASQLGCGSKYACYAFADDTARNNSGWLIIEIPIHATSAQYYPSHLTACLLPQLNQ